MNPITDINLDSLDVQQARFTSVDHGEGAVTVSMPRSAWETADRPTSITVTFDDENMPE